MSQAALPPPRLKPFEQKEAKGARFPQTAGFLQMTFSSTSNSLTGPLLPPLSPVELLPLLPLLTSVQILYPHVASRFAHRRGLDAPKPLQLRRPERRDARTHDVSTRWMLKPAIWHHCLSAEIGSIRAARRAGIQQAIEAVLASSRMVKPRVKASLPVTP